MSELHRALDEILEVVERKNAQEDYISRREAFHLRREILRIRDVAREMMEGTKTC